MNSGPRSCTTARWSPSMTRASGSCIGTGCGPIMPTAGSTAVGTAGEPGLEPRLRCIGSPTHQVPRLYPYRQRSGHSFLLCRLGRGCHSFGDDRMAMFARPAGLGAAGGVSRLATSRSLVKGRADTWLHARALFAADGAGVAAYVRRQQSSRCRGGCCSSACYSGVRG
jgi:hypothetical protein